MSKRPRENRRGKQAAPAQGGKRKVRRSAAAVYLAIAVLLSLGFWWWNSRSAASNSQFEKLIGRWQRPDGSYVVAIKSIADNGAIDAAYFNPKSIHVAKAEASRDGDATTVIIELRDVNYPGSNYTLTYDPTGDQLKGIYYQAVEQQRFPVAFARVK